MSRLALPAGMLLVFGAAWLSQGTIALATIDGPRIAVLPTTASAFLIAAASGAMIGALLRAGASIAPLSLLALILLPWLPAPLPAAFLLWAGAIRWFVWAGVVLLLIATLPARLRRSAVPPGVTTFLHERPRLAAGLLAFLIFAGSAWQASPSMPGGDEPHYLVITQSLLLDGDLKIENNHKRGDYQAYYAGALTPHYVRRGRNGEIYSIHAPGLSVLITPAFAIAGYHGVVVFLLLIAACGSALAWHLAWLTTRSTASAWFGWAAVTLSPTAIFHSFSVYPDGVGGVLALTGVWALLRAEEERITSSTRASPWILHGAALAMLPWLHSRFAVLAGSLGALILLRLPWTKNSMGKAVAFLWIPAVSALAWIGFFVVIYGVPDPSAPYGTSRDFSIAFVPGGLAGLLLDQRFGLVANAPVLLFGGVGLFLMLRYQRIGSAAPVRTRPLAIELLFVLVSYLVSATSYAMWWAGSSAPARLATPTLPALAIPCAVAWSLLRHRASRMTAAGALTLTAVLSFVLVTTNGGRLAYNSRDTTALWLDWASRLTALGDGLPVWFRGQEGVFARDAAVWMVLVVIAWGCARAIEGFPALRDRGRFATAVAGLYATSAMFAVTVVWTLHGADGITGPPAQLDVLRRAARESRLLAIQIAPPRRIDSRDVPAMLRIESTIRPRAGGGMGRSEQPLTTLPSVPAGRYRILARTRAQGGWVMLGVGQDQFAIRSEALPWPPAPMEIEFPVDVRALVIKGDEEARRTIRNLVVEPLAVVPAEARLTAAVARTAVKYGGVSVFFLDNSSYPEPEAFWVGGKRESSVAMQTDQARSALPILLRNAPVNNRIVIASGEWREELSLEPNEERHVIVPLAPGHRAAIVTISSESGFRPSETSPGSRDERLLGVWVRVE